jgi:hypothetical protein
MINFQEEALRFELGKTANFWLYDRDNRTPMNFVLDEVERQIGPRFSVYWVDDGPPEVFTLPNLSPSPVVFSTRYLSLTAFIRHLFDGRLPNAPRSNLCQRWPSGVVTQTMQFWPSSSL